MRRILDLGDDKDYSAQFNSLFIYVLNSRANGQLQSQHEYKQQQHDNTGQNKKKTNNKSNNKNKDKWISLGF
jgi:hypothetical protein